MSTTQNLTAQEKISWIEAELIKRRGEQLARKFMGDVVVYASMNEEPDYSDDDMMQKVWEKTKSLIDEDRASKLNSTDRVRFEDLKALLNSLKAIDRAKLEELARGVDIDPDELEWFLGSDLGEIYGRESYEALLAEGESAFDSYEEFLEAGYIAVNSTMVSDYYGLVSTRLKFAQQYGSELTFDEMLVEHQELTRLRFLKDWDAWSKRLKNIREKPKGNMQE